MDTVYYRKGTDPMLDADFAAATTYANIKLGKHNLFYKKGIRRCLLPLSAVTGAYLRIEEATSHVGCCPQYFNLAKLMVRLSGGEELALTIGDCLYRHEDEQLLIALREQQPQIRIGVQKA